MDYSDLHVGITGGTMLMSAVASSMASAFGIPMFYVREPPEGKGVVARRDVISLTSSKALKICHSLPPDVIRSLLDTDKLYEIMNPDGIMFYNLQRHGIILIEEGVPSLTRSGRALLNAAYEHPAVQHIIKSSEVEEDEASITDAMYV